MRKLIISAVLLSSMAAAAPAVAQGYGWRGDDRYDRRGDHYDRWDDDRSHWRGDNRFDRQIDQLVDRIQRAEARNLITRREENRLMRQARHINALERRYSRNGFSRWEAQDLQRRIQDLRRQFRWERADGRYGYYR